jgi:soluble lytic murein transglycosylase-like protein
MMVRPELRSIIEMRALEFEIDPDLIEAFCLVESSGNPRATRYEANFYKTYIQPMLHNNAITPEEAMGRATSFGIMQIMGQVAREKGFKGKFEELFEPGTGLFWSLKHLKHFIDKYAPNLDNAIASYNAGSPRKDDSGNYRNQIYVDRIHKFLKQIKGII